MLIFSLSLLKRKYIKMQIHRFYIFVLAVYVFSSCTSLDFEKINGSLQIYDVCNLIFPTGLSQYGDIYTFSNGSSSGTSFSFSWDNTYGELGTVTLTRQDGRDWPPLRTE